MWPSIPKQATERVVARHRSGAKARSVFRHAGQIVGEMLWEEDGRPTWGWSLHNGRKHGLEVEWWDNGQPSFATPYVKGLAHGVARHWDESGKLLLETRFTRGTGVDLWCDRYNWTLSEETRVRAGCLHGFLRRWNPDGRTVYREEHWADGGEHGVFREWNDEGRLRRGFPQYFVQGTRVDRRAYERAARSDATLPRVVRRDDDPRRALPVELVGQPVERRMRRLNSNRLRRSPPSSRTR